MTCGNRAAGCLWSAVVLCVVTLGCGGPERKSEWPVTHPVSGVITIDGEPMPNVMVSFSPASGQYAARGRTNDAGEYELRTFFSPQHDDVGAAAGEYAVTMFMAGDLESEKEKKRQAEVEKLKAEAEANEDQEKAAEVAAAAQAAQYSKGYRPRVKSGLPQKYLTPETTPLSATVVDGENTFDFDLSKKD